jgi:hypothetical protein
VAYLVFKIFVQVAFPVTDLDCIFHVAQEASNPLGRGLPLEALLVLVLSLFPGGFAGTIGISPPPLLIDQAHDHVCF